MSSTDSEPPNRVSGCFVDKNILISGGSGFMGKVLVEKLLRSCSGLNRIYLLIRTKKGKDAKERLTKDIFGNPVSF